MSITLNAQKRSDTGKGASRRLRREAGRVPAILFGDASNKKPQPLTLEHKDLLKVSETLTFFSTILNLNIDGDSEPVIVKDIQRHPAKQEILHVDFMRVVDTNLIRVLVPIKFLNEGSCPAVKTGGGRISHQQTEVAITCLPVDLPEYVHVDMMDVPVGGIVHLSDIKLPKGAHIRALNLGGDYDQAVATITAKRGS
jgi:large subunit ribosomal protein L25